MSNKIIQITEENLRKAVEVNDLKLLALEVFEVKKIRVQTKVDLWWNNPGCSCIFPLIHNIEKDTNGKIKSLRDLLGKSMTMTLEWEE